MATVFFNMAGVISSGVPVWDAADSAGEWGQTDSTAALEDAASGFFPARQAEARQLFLEAGQASTPALWRAAGGASSRAPAPKPQETNPLAELRFEIARRFGEICLKGGEPGDADGNKFHLLYVHPVDPLAYRDSTEWLEVLKNTCFMLWNEVRPMRIYRFAPMTESRPKGPRTLRFHPPKRYEQVFPGKTISDSEAILLFEIIPNRSDSKVAQREGIEAFHERMWERFIKRLQRKLRQPERG